MCRQSATVCLVKSPAAVQRALPSVESRLAVLVDPRDRRGGGIRWCRCCSRPAARSWPVPAPMRPVGQWAASAPQDALARLEVRTTGPLGVRRAPAASTIRRVLTLACPGGLADLLGRDPSGARSLAVDGKTARGSRTDTTTAAHLLSAVLPGGHAVAQLRVPDKTTEVTGFTALLAPFDLTGVTVTADALHTCRDHAKWLVETKKAHYLLVVKRNQPLLHMALRALPWKQVTARRYDRGSGHGRRETRSVRALTVTGLGLDFPHVVQAAKIVRYRVCVKTGKVTRKTIYTITDLPATAASPQLIAQLARSQREIEAVHHVRDTVFAEDASKIRTGHGPANMATLRNFAISTLRTAGHRSIAAGLRHLSYQPHTRPLDLIGLP